jgi:hypothetical protein
LGECFDVVEETSPPAGFSAASLPSVGIRARVFEVGAGGEDAPCPLQDDDPLGGRCCVSNHVLERRENLGPQGVEPVGTVERDRPHVAFVGHSDESHRPIMPNT